MKNLLLTLYVLLISYGMYAQLHVQPNPSTLTDSYIYANDVVLYVNDAISLNVNSNPQTRASIYLRGDAQLFQGDKGASLNTGNGHLSVWQRGFANAFDYNNWSSPIGNPNIAPITGNTNFGIPRIFDVQNDGSNNLHPTFSIQQASTTALNGEYSDVSTGAGPLRVSQRWIYTLRAQSGYANWIYIAGANNGLAPGEGFTMKGTGTFAQVGDAHNQLYDFRGRPNDGTITVNVAAGQETFGGNPYPSTLDMAAFVAANPQIEGTIYYWDQDRSTNNHNLETYQGGYGTWVPFGGDSVPAEYGGGLTGIYTNATFIMYDGAGNPLPGDVGNGTYSATTARFAGIAQGFMLRGTANGTATYNNTMRRFVPRTSPFLQFRNLGSNSLSGSLPSTEQSTYVLPTLRFHIEVNTLYVRDMVLMFDPTTTKSEDRGYDGKHPSVIAGGDTFWKLENSTSPFVIQTRPFDEYDMIPLGLKTRNGATTFRVKLVENHHLNHQRMYLFDNTNNTYREIKMTDNGYVDIQINGSATTIDNRFFITFRRDAHNADSPNRTAESLNFNFFQNNVLSQLEVYNPEVIDVKQAFVYDMSGKMVIHQKNLGYKNILFQQQI